MKKVISALALTALITPVANATTARLLAFGMNETDSEGMYFISDDRNIFLNASSIHEHADKVIVELGGKGKSLATNNTVDKDYAPKARGGFLKSTGNFVYGLYLGNESNTSSLLRILADNGNLRSADNQTDIFFGGGKNLKWAVNFLYSNGEDEINKREDTAYTTRLGLTSDRWNVFANVSLKSESSDTVANTKFDGKLGLHLGGTFNLTDSLDFYGFWKQFDWDQSAANVTTEGSLTSYAVGLAKKVETSDNGFVFTSVEYRSKEVELKYASNPTNAENTFVPVTLGFEAHATSWLTLRGSVVQNVYGYKKNKNYSSLNSTAKTAVAPAEFGTDTNGKKVTLSNTTSVNAGASLNFGKLNVDGLIGGLNNGSSIAKNGNLRLDQLLYRVGMTYSF